MSIEFTVSGSVATITLNRPDKLNALTDRMWADLADMLDRCRDDDAIRSVILTGAGRGFCAGADLGGADKKERPAGVPGAVAAMNDYNAVIARLRHLPKPVIAAVRGPVVGIAWTMVLCCDFVLASETAKFRPAFMNLAKVPEGGFMHLVERAIGTMRTREIVYRARFVLAEEAAELGLVTRMVEDTALDSEARELAAELAGSPPLTFALTKELFESLPVMDFDGFVRSERNAIAAAANTQDAREAMAAFREKRAPVYSGT